MAAQCPCSARETVHDPFWLCFFLLSQAFGPKRLDAARAEVLFDMGMGCGKVVVQAFLQFRNLKYVYGVELSLGRYKYVSRRHYAGHLLRNAVSHN